MDESLINTIEEKIQLIQEVEKTYQSISQRTSNLHVRYAPIIEKEPLVELSITFDLLDDEIQNQLSEYVEDYYIPVKDKNQSQIQRYYGKIIRLENLDNVMKILGLVEVVDTTHQRDLFDKLIAEYRGVFDLLETVFSNGEIVEEYFGDTFYPKIIDMTFAYSIDSDYCYLHDYSVDDIPSILRIERKNTIFNAIQLTCISAESLNFYRTY